MMKAVVTAEQLEAAKQEHGICKVFELIDGDGNSHGDVIMKRPSPTVISEFEKFIDRNPLKARMVLINGCLVTRQEEVKDWDKNSEEYAAAFDAAAQMLPVGKASVKKL